MAASVQIPVTQTGLEASIQAALRNAGKGAQINLGTNSRQINALAQPLGRITGQADEFTKSMEAANARVFAFGASVGIINGVTSAFSSLVKSTIAVEKSLTEINSVFQKSSSELEKFGNSLFDVAKNTGQSFDAVAKGALELARQGLSTEESLRRINDALILTRLSGLDAERSVSGLTAAVNAFKSTGITTSEVLNKLVVVSQKYSVSEKDLIEGLKRSSSVAKQAGVSFDELVGIITAVQEKTSVGGAVIGNSFKTIFTRLQRTDTLDALQQLGVSVTDVQGRILPATKLLENLAGTIKSLNQVQLAEITERVGGGFQIDKLIATLEDLSSQSSVAFKATELSLKSTNEAYEKNAALNVTLAALINKTSLSAEQLGATLGKIGITDSAKSLLGFFNGLLEGIQKILGEESALGDVFRGLAKGIGNLVTGPGLALFAAIILKLSKDLAQFGFASLKGFFGIGKAAKEIQNVEQSIASALSRNVGLQRQLFALEGNRAAQIKLMSDAIVLQEAAMRRMASTAGALAAPLYGQGVRSTGEGLRVPRAAGGYTPAVSQESSDIRKGVGGARSGDRPVVIPNFAFGGGKKGAMVAHTGEYIVPNFANGGSAIFNRNMVQSMGLPSGAKKISAAGGFVPNFSTFNQREYDSLFNKFKSGTKVADLEKYASGQGRDKSPEYIRAAKDALSFKSVKFSNVWDAESTPRSVMLLPNALSGIEFSHMFKEPYPDKKGYDSFIGKAYGIDPNLSKDSEFQKLLKLDSIMDESLANAANFVLQQVKPNIHPDPESVNSSNIKNLINAAGGAGALGSIRGALFEAVTNSIVKGISKESVEPGGDNTLDVAFDGKKRKTLEQIFGLPNNHYDFGDYKNSLEQKDKYVRQVIDNLGPLKKSKMPRASKGFIPNFSDPIGQAVNREMAAGVPASQIYIDKNSSLKSAANPMGLMVANRRDEPAGGYQGINRAIKEGRNPKTYGAASGFIPNYADAPDISGYVGKTRSAALAEATAKYQKALDAITNEIDKHTVSSKALHKSRIREKKVLDDRIAALKQDEAVLKQSSEATKKAIIQQSKGFLGTGKTLTRKEATVQPQAGQKDMLGTIFALQGAFSVLSGYTDNLSGKMGLVIKGLTSMASGITTAAFAYQGAQRLVTESTGGVGKALGKVGMVGAVALAAFEIFKGSKQIYRDWSGKTADAAKATAQFNDAVKNAGISLDGLSETARNQKIVSAKGALYNLGVGLEGGLGLAFKDKETQRIYAETAYQTGMTEEDFQKLLIEKGATRKTSSYKDSKNYLVTDEDKFKAVAAEAVQMPKKLLENGAINPEYEKRIKAISERKKEQAEIQRDINQAEKDSSESVENTRRINAANLSLLQLQLQNRIAYKNALFEVMSAEEYSLSLQKEMLSVGENDRMQADYKLQSLQAAKKATLEQANATVEVLKNSELINNKLKGAGIGLDEINPEKFKEIAGISEEISYSIKKQGGFTKEVENKTNELLTPLGLTVDQQKLILDLLKETNGEIDKRISLETKVNALNNLQKATLEASNFATQKRLDSITSTYDATSKKNEIDKKNLDLELEAFKIQKEREKIGKGGAATLAIDKEIIQKEKITLKAKLDIDKQDLIVQVQKTLADAAIKAGATPDQIAGLNLGGINDQSKAIEAAEKIEQIEKDIQIEKIKIAQTEFESKIQSSNFLYTKIIEAANGFKDIILNVLPKSKEILPEDLKKSLDKGVAGFDPLNKVVEESKKRSAEAIKALKEPSSSILLQQINEKFQEGIFTIKEYENAFGSLNNSIISAGGNLVTFSSLVNDVFKNLPDDIAQNKFSYLTTTDPQSMISAALQDTKLSVLKSGPATEDTIVAAADKVALLEKELEIKRSTTTEAKIGAEFELEKLKEILPLRLELLKAETDEERIKIIDKIIAKEKERLPLAKRLESIFTSSPEEQKNRLEDTIVQASEQFKSNMIDGISEAIEGGKSLGEVLQNSAYEFVKAINKQLMSNLVDSIVGSGKQAASGGSGFLSSVMSSIGFASGGMISGGSGTKDDVPAMLMGGEYVINKKSVGRYGPKFLEAINNGTLGGYAQGGKVQSGKGGFFTPGTYGLGGIQGTGNLLKFATQAYTSGARDQIVNQGNYASINLEAESARLTNFGRSNSPQAEATRSAKEQAFGLYVQEIQAQQEAQKQAEAESDALKKQLMLSVVLAAGSGFFKAYAGSGATGMARLSDAAKGIWSGFEGKGGLTNLFSFGGSSSAKPSSKNTNGANGYDVNPYDNDQINEVNSALGGLGVSPLNFGGSNNGVYNNNIPAFTTGPFDAQGNYIEERANERFATGGSVPFKGGIDTVPAMLSGGEFIMNRSAAQNIGAGNLQALNAGAGTIVTEEKTEELNEKLIAKLDELIEASGGASNITINVEGSTGAATQSTNGNPTDQRQQMARQIKDAVLKILQDEKRLGGQLRR